MLEAMKRKRQQEILKSQMKINENNQRNCANNNFDFRRFSLHHQQQQQQQQLNGIFNQKQHHQPPNLQQSNINSLMLAKSSSEMMLQQQLQRQQQSQYPYRGINFPINQQSAPIGTQQQHHRQQHHNPFMGRPILKSSIGSMNNNNSCPIETTK